MNYDYDHWYSSYESILSYVILHAYVRVHDRYGMMRILLLHNFQHTIFKYQRNITWTLKFQIRLITSILKREVNFDLRDRIVIFWYVSFYLIWKFSQIYLNLNLARESYSKSRAT